MQPEAIECSGHIRRCGNASRFRAGVGCGFPADSLTLDEWDREKSDREDIETSEDDERLVSSCYDSVHPFRAHAQQATGAGGQQQTTRLDGLSIRIGLRTAI